MNVPSVEIVILFFGHLFNRAYVFISVALSGVFAYTYPDYILHHGALSQYSRNNVMDLNLRISAAFMIFNIIAVLLTVATT